MCKVSKFLWVLSAVSVISVGSKYLPQSKYHLPEPKLRYNAVIKLTLNGRGFCSAVVVSDRYALTAAHCLDIPVNPYMPNILGVNSAKGEVTSTLFRPFRFSPQMDYGAIEGDFSQFDRLKMHSEINPFIDYMESERWACGFPLNKTTYICTKFIGSFFLDFQVVGSGYVAPGFSGGPVINRSTGLLEGLVVAENIVVPVFGIETALGLELDK